MEKFETLEMLQDAGIDVADELVRAMSDMQADDFLGYLATMHDIDFENEDENKDDTPRYDIPEIQAAYEFACKWDYDEETAAAICDQCDGYGSTIFSVSADEWYSDADMREDYDCLIGEDSALSTFIIELR